MVMDSQFCCIAKMCVNESYDNLCGFFVGANIFFCLGRNCHSKCYNEHIAKSLHKRSNRMDDIRGKIVYLLYDM